MQIYIHTYRLAECLFSENLLSIWSGYSPKKRKDGVYLESTLVYIVYGDPQGVNVGVMKLKKKYWTTHKQIKSSNNWIKIGWDCIRATA